ncbi:hypothetical protein A1O7_08483 [Cladophialophora yegresii CBS 114405]|uniref:RRM domain-containing protein n=1 Tax=Cladophialophora yegresii CBS 114405 TaxID=1182544 RepID=W9VRB0_9EURO|nr:uncharacterized protein A1O7_08483 [Cladophialophora yegresii CBS 114405]EXJ55555.1 hypothetical protein A1O7_08483 [Cladophialophora yegresii CBS 114405]
MSSKDRPAGVLPVNAAARKTAASNSSQKLSQRSPATRLRLIIRRLPPGLTEMEFWAALGDEWRVGSGKVEWAAYHDGKVSRDPAKPSRPARAYLKVKEQALLDTLSVVLKETTFQDARNTTKDPCLLGPPSLEFAPYNKTPSGRIRHDGRQGTIDQDQEFIYFLQSLTEPITKATGNGTESGELKTEPVTITPLVQYIKEKKANKAKEAAQAKAAKSASKEAKPTKNERTPTVIIKGKATPAATEKEKDKEKEKERVAKATQDAIKAVQKSVAAVQGKQSSVPAKSEREHPATIETTPTAQSQPTESAKQDRNRAPRDNARGAARMLQRDLGLLAKGNTSPRTPKATASASASSPATQPPSTLAKPTAAANSAESAPSQQTSSGPATPTTPVAPPSGPRASRASRTPSAATSSSANQAPITPSQAATTQPQPHPNRVKPQPSPPQPSAGAKSAFLKHANPSQGITEDLLKEAFKSFGTITRCEIDKKKGLGYVDFAEHEGLKKAMAASPVKVANGQVVVLENKSPHGKRGGQTAVTQKSSPTPAPAAGSAVTKAIAGPGSPAVNSPKPAVPTPAPTATTQAQITGTPAAPAAPGSTSASTPVATAPPTAPRGANRGGRGGGARGNARGGAATQGQGQGQGQNQGQGPSSRQGHRGGRGNFRGGGRGGGPAATNASPATGGESAAGSGSANTPGATAAPAAAKEEAKEA